MYKNKRSDTILESDNSRNHAEFNFIIQLPHHFAFRINLDQLGVFPFTGFAVVPLPVTDIKSPFCKGKSWATKRVVHLLCHWHSPGEQSDSIQDSVARNNERLHKQPDSLRCPEKQRKKEYQRALHYSAVDH